jgi:Family of unknown function (DUF6528)
MNIRLFLAAAVVGLLGATHPVGTQSPSHELIVCGWDEVFIIDVRASAPGPPKRIWTWRAADRPELPEDFKPLFRTTDECKPVDGGARILITSSGSGVALVNRADGRVLFHARVANAHSAEVLPNNRVAVAASHDPKGKGDRLVVFDIGTANVELLSEELPWGHGVEWDAERNRLWALADKDIRAFELRNWQSAKPALLRTEVIALPEGMGHNLSAIAGTPSLAVSTTNHCWLFDRDAKTFRRHPELGDAKGVKSISYHPVTHHIAYVQNEGKNWWAEHIHFLYPAGAIHVPGEHFYKARWNATNR